MNNKNADTSTTRVNIKLDKEIKEKAEVLFNELGLNMTAAINIFIRQSLREKGIPFEISLNVPNAETIKAIEEVEKETGISKSFSSVDELMGDLDNDN